MSFEVSKSRLKFRFVLIRKIERLRDKLRTALLRIKTPSIRDPMQIERDLGELIRDPTKIRLSEFLMRIRDQMDLRALREIRVVYGGKSMNQSSSGARSAPEKKNRLFKAFYSVKTLIV